MSRKASTFGMNNVCVIYRYSIKLVLKIHQNCLGPKMNIPRMKSIVLILATETHKWSWESHKE